MISFYNLASICNNNNLTLIFLLNIQLPELDINECIHLAFVYYSNTISIYLNDSLETVNIQSFNLSSLIYSSILSQFDKINYAIVYDIKVYDIAMNSNQISNDYNTFKSACISTTKSTSTSTSTSTSFSSLPGFGRTDLSVDSKDIGIININTGRRIGACSDLSNIDSAEFVTSVCFIKI
jgi:hypothetical protein